MPSARRTPLRAPSAPISQPARIDRRPSGVSATTVTPVSSWPTSTTSCCHSTVAES
jgi:hypothetical protein